MFLPPMEGVFFCFFFFRGEEGEGIFGLLRHFKQPSSRRPPSLTMSWRNSKDTPSYSDSSSPLGLGVPFSLDRCGARKAGFRPRRRRWGRGVQSAQRLLLSWPRTPTGPKHLLLTPC